MTQQGHITDDMRGVLVHLIKSNVSKEALLAVLEVIPPCPFEEMKPKKDEQETKHYPPLRTRSSIRKHPPVKSEDGKLLAPSIHSFARNHNPEIKYEGMRNAIDVLTACHSLEGLEHSFHYEIIRYQKDGVYIKKIYSRGFRTNKEDVLELRRKAGFTD